MSERSYHSSYSSSPQPQVLTAPAPGHIYIPPFPISPVIHAPGDIYIPPNILAASKTVNLNGSKKSVWIAKDYIPGEMGYTEGHESVHEIYASLKDAKSKDIKKSIGKLHIKAENKVVIKHGQWKHVVHMSFLFHDNTHVLFLPTVATVDESNSSKTVMVDFEAICTHHIHRVEAIHEPSDHHMVQLRMSEINTVQHAAHQQESKQSSSLMDELLHAASEKLSEKIKKMVADSMK